MANSYERFIRSIRDSRPLNEYFKGSELHHITPKCVGGSNDPSNLIYLTFAEHFEAHKLLVECYPGNKKLSYALWRMANGKRDCSPNDYDFARKSFIGNGTPDEVRNKIRNSHIGKSSGMLGKKHSSDARRKMSEAQKRRVRPTNPPRGWTHSDSFKEKHRQLYYRNVYHITCRECKTTFVASRPSFRYCDDCRTRRKRK